jgi:O-methyltransferase domain/Dimerisation domain
MHPEASPAPPFGVLFQMVNAKWVSSAISVAAKLGIADRLELGPKTAKQLAGELNVHERALYRLLRALASVGVFHEGDGELFSQTPLSDPLRSHANPSLRNVAMMLIDDWHIRNWAALDWTIQTGRSASEKVFGMSIFEYLSGHPEEAANFNGAMTDLSQGDGPAVVAAYDFSRFESIVDVGGGAGSLLAAILESAPKLRGTLLDMQYVIEQAREGPLLRRFAARCDFVGGSFFDAVPKDADGYILKHVIHDWDDAHSTKILSNCRAAMRASSTLLVVDRVVGPPNQPDQAKLFDLEMMVNPGGLERSEPEWRSLFGASGFRLERIIPMRTPQSILEATPLASA